MKALIGEKEFLVESGAKGTSINGKPYHADIIEMVPGKFHALLDNKSFSASEPVSVIDFAVSSCVVVLCEFATGAVFDVVNV